MEGLRQAAKQGVEALLARSGAGRALGGSGRGDALVLAFEKNALHVQSVAADKALVEAILAEARQRKVDVLDLF